MVAQNKQKPSTAYDLGDISRFNGMVLNDVIPKHDRLWIHYPHIRKLNLLLLCAMLTQITSGFDGSMLNGLQSLPSWRNYFDHPTGARLGSMTNGITFGTLIAVPFTSYINERYGRRLPIMGGCALIVVGAIIQGAAQNYPMFVVARFLVGMGLCVAQTSAPLLLVECAYPGQRGKVTSFIEPAWPVGSFIAALITYGCYQSPIRSSTWGWRIPSLLQGFFPLIQIAVGLSCPESPRWLIAHDRHEEAFEFFVKYHAGGDRESDLVQFQMAEVSATLEAEKIMHQSKWSQWFKTKGMRHRFFIACFVPMMLQLSGNALQSYYLSIILNNIGITVPKTQLLINLGSTAWGIITAYAFASQVDRIGRRPGFLFGLIAMLISYIVWTIISAINQERNFEDKSLAAGTIVVMYIYSGFYHLTSPFGPTYTVEVVPFSLRSKATMLYQLCGNVAGVFNNYVNPIAMTAITWRYYIVWICNICFEIVLVYFFFPETGGKGLEEIAEVFDGKDALVGIEGLDHIGLADMDKPDAQSVEYVDAPAKPVALHA